MVQSQIYESTRHGTKRSLDGDPTSFLTLEVAHAISRHDVDEFEIPAGPYGRLQSERPPATREMVTA